MTDRGSAALSPERMTEDAYERLYEAVNTGRLIGFIGAGFSPIYGHLTWKDFIDEMVVRLQLKVDGLLDPQLPRHKFNDLTRIKAQIKAIEDRSDDEGIVVLEFVRKSFSLFDAEGDEVGTTYRDALHDLFASNKVFVSRLTAPRLELAGFQAPGGERLQDMLNLSADYMKKQYPGDPALDLLFPDVAGWCDADCPKTVGEAIFRLSPTLCSIDSIRTLLKCVDGSQHRKLEKLKDEIEKAMKDHQRGPSLPIDRRSVMVVFLAAAVLDTKPGNLPLGQLLKPLHNAHPARPLLDPLRSLSENLSIHRYVTTNYDEEIEHLFMYDDLQDSDRAIALDERRAELLKRPEFESELNDAIITRYRPDGVRVQSIVNDGKHTAPLYEFGMGPSDNSILIYHHHGRQDLSRTLIAADGEYNRMYRADGLNRPSLDRAYDAMIEGNPMLFIGSGMTEEELTRTLRSRVSNQRSPTDTPSFVLRAAKGKPRDLMREQMNFATKLDLRVIHYGHPRRGSGFSLREHLILIDRLAERYLGETAGR